MSQAANIVIFGASGDLTSRKLIPALYDNFRKERLHPDTRIIGVSRTKMSDDEFREHLHRFAQESLGRSYDEQCWSRFAPQVHYCPGDIGNTDDYARLREMLNKCEGGASRGRLYYLSIAPGLYATALEQLGATGLGIESNGWRRVIVEKPFGRDLETARGLNRTVHEVFDEHQVYRIDHYLGKETVQNLLALRFANAVFEPLWNRNYVDHVQITVAERVQVGDRGSYYDRSGVLRDMFQNHLMQVLALIAMEPPARYEANALRDEKVKVLNAVRVPSADAVDQYSVVGQYAGYHNEEGVEDHSVTPTFAAVKLFVDNWRWQGVPFYLRSGKALAGKMTEVIIEFRKPPHLMFEASTVEKVAPNRLAVTVQPDEGIHLSFETKVPGKGMTLRSSELDFLYSESFTEEPIPDAYERLLLDAINGDASLFIRGDEIELAWGIMDPVIRGWESRPPESLPMYKPGTWGPVEAERFMQAEGRRWINDAARRQSV